MAVTYGYLCEDKALELFVDETLKALELKTKCKAFEKVNIPNPIIATNRNQVIAWYKDAAKKVISDNKLDLFIAAYDWDSANIGDYDAALKKQIADINGKARNRTVVCVPIKCIEYWLWYVKHADDENRPAPNSLETNVQFNGDMAKSDVYQRALDEKGKYSGQSTKTELEKARLILAKLNIENLKMLSPSFGHFVRQIEQFCSTYR